MLMWVKKTHYVQFSLDLEEKGHMKNKCLFKLFLVHKKKWKPEMLPTANKSSKKLCNALRATTA